jgi:acetyl-CoA/propionyl-CoA carboxylase carboxyl transferase subunit
MSALLPGIGAPATVPSGPPSGHVVRVGGDPRDPAARLDRLLDGGPIASIRQPDDTGVTTVVGRVAGIRAVAFCTDATTMGGSLGAPGAERIVEAIGTAERLRCPVIGLWHSGGARLADGVESMHGVGRMFAAMTRASGRVPQISVVLGPAAGAAAYGPALTDVVVLSDQGRIFVTGPEVVRTVTGESIEMSALGGPDAHGPKSGVAHVVAADEPEAYQRARALTRLLGNQGIGAPAGAADRPDPGSLLPASPRRAYDVRPLLAAILDEDPDTGGLLVLQPRWAPNVVIGLGRLAGRTVGVVANNPIRKGGCLDSRSAEKAARFVRMCDSLGVPLLVVVDVPGYLPGVQQEWGGVVRRGAKLLHAFAEAKVPRVTLITRKAYGGAYIAMNSRSLGATAVFAWPDAEVAVMGAEAAVGILHRKRLAAVPAGGAELMREQLVREHRTAAGGLPRAVALGVVDEVIEPVRSRSRVAEALAAAPERRGRHGNIPL